MVTIKIRCIGEGNIRVMVPDLLFEGLKTLEDEDKDVCFLIPDNYAEQVRKRNGMPVKFQRIYGNWSTFEEPLVKIRSELKKGQIEILPPFNDARKLHGSKGPTQEVCYGLGRHTKGRREGQDYL